MKDRSRVPVSDTSQPSAPAAGGWLCLAALLAASGVACGGPGAAPSPDPTDGTDPVSAPTADPSVKPVLDFPEAGLDDPAAYAGYRTRFFRDRAGNTVQVYVNAADGRVVTLWADAANESLGFTARDGANRPVALAWAGDGARVGQEGPARWLEMDLVAPGEDGVRLGLFLLGTMRYERDVQYQALHRGPLDAPLRIPELVGLVDRLDRLRPDERAPHLAALDAPDVDALRARLEPALSLDRAPGGWRLRATRPSFDGRGQLALELSSAGGARLEGRTLVLGPTGSGPVRLTLRVRTDAPALTPLARDEIFTPAFLAYVEEAGRGTDPGDALRHRRLERQVRGAELLSSREKLMAGLPNFATYFGRDMLMTALMMEAIWAPGMTEHVIASALRKLGPDGGVSHEEAVGEQAIREAAAEYNRLADRALGLEPGDRHRTRLLAEATAVLETMAVPRENHNMVDDDFQLPVVVARWLADARVPADRKRAFLRAREGPAGVTRLEGIVRNIGLVAARTAAYTAEPRPINLVSFPPLGAGRWMSASWRDSGPGYGNGRYALDVNAIWAPHALAAAGAILRATGELGLEAELEAALARQPAELTRLADEPGRLREAVATWSGAAAHFLVELGRPAVAAAVADKLSSLPETEAAYWRAALDRSGEPRRGLRFLAVALDSLGQPVPVASTDPAMALFLGAPTAAPAGLNPAEVLDPVLAPYPVGLLVPGVGPVVSNDAYATAAVRAAFEADGYHSPRTVWGRETNLLLLALARMSAGSPADGEAAVAEMMAVRSALDSILAAVEASGLKHHELWSYRVDSAGPVPARYGTSSDVQLWNVTDLAVQHALSEVRCSTC